MRRCGGSASNAWRRILQRSSIIRGVTTAARPAPHPFASAGPLPPSPPPPPDSRVVPGLPSAATAGGHRVAPRRGNVGSASRRRRGGLPWRVSIGGRASPPARRCPLARTRGSLGRCVRRPGSRTTTAEPRRPRPTRPPRLRPSLLLPPPPRRLAPAARCSSPAQETRSRRRPRSPRRCARPPATSKPSARRPSTGPARPRPFPCLLGGRPQAVPPPPSESSTRPGCVSSRSPPWASCLRERWAR